MKHEVLEREIEELTGLILEAELQVQCGRDAARRQAQIGLNITPLWKLLNAEASVFAAFRQRRDFLVGICQLIR